MSLTNDINSQKSSQILTFPVENRPPQLSISTDDKDIRHLYVKYHSMVYRRCLYFLHNEENAKDVASDVFKKLQELKTEGKLNIEFPETYLSRMAKNMSINERKKRDRERKELIKIYDIATNEIINQAINMGKQEQEIWELGIIENGYEQAEVEIIVKNILDEQDEITRKIYINKYYKDMTLEQIGETVGLKKSAVQKRIKKLEKQIKAEMKGDGK